MQKFMRYSISGLAGGAITAGLFVGMLNLLDGEKPSFSTEATDIRFSFVKDYEPIKTEKNDRPDKPEPQEVTQAPAMPQMPSIADDDFGPLDVPVKGESSSHPNLIKGIGLPGFGNGGGYGTGGQQGALKTGFAPLYPRAAMVSKTEGWVRLLIEVNEFGQVSGASVIDAEPARVFNNAALKAVRKWTFHPKKVNGQGMPFQVTQTIEFTLDQ